MFTKNQLPSYYFGSNKNNDQTNIQTRSIASLYIRPTRNEVNIDKDTILTPVLTKDESVFKVLNTTIEDLHLSEPNLPIAISPTSSLASNKKLEWDSGADIGYNFQDSLHRKCKSFPLLNMDFSISRINSDVSIDTALTDKNCQLTNKNSKVSKINKDIQAIKHSTPYDRNRDELREGVHNKNESMQTSLVHYCSKSIQTDFDNDRLHINKSQQTETLKRTPTDYSSNSASTSKSSFEYIPGSNFSSKCSVKSTKSSIEIPDSSKTSLRSKLKNSISSLEILEIKSPKSETNVSSKSQSNSSIRDSKSVEDEVIIFNLNSAKNSKCSNSSKNSSTTRSSESSNSSPLGKMISTQHSKILVDDIDQSLHLLQQFIKSDHYNAETKKYYAKKVVSKLIQFKYSGDSSSDSYSVASTQNDKSQIDSVKSDKIISPKYKKEKLQKDELESENRKTKHKKMRHQFIAENQSGNSESNSIKSDKTQKEKLDSLKQCDCINNDKLSPKYKSEIKSHLQEISNKLKEFKLQNSSGESCSSSNKNWRDNKTVSEKLLEAKLKSNESPKLVEKYSVEIQTDSNFTQRVHDEKTRQLSWIKKEINYLIRLQGLLENSDLPSENSSIKSINEHYDSRRSQLENCIHHLSSQSLNTDHNKTDSQNSTKNSSSLEKLSKILTNDQLKFYINNIASNHRDSCDCCDFLFVKPTPKDQTAESSRRFSYNSHNYTVDNIARSCQGSKKKSPRETEIKSELQPTGKIDAETQCTSRSSNKTRSSETVTDNTKNTTLIFENNVVNSESSVLSELSNKENCICKQRRKRNPYTETKCECHPNPYFLTFEEGSTIDMCQYAPKRKPLETVTVKVPKFGNKVKRRANSYTSLTLEEYLKENRPDFVAAAEWRRRFVSDRGYDQNYCLHRER